MTIQYHCIFLINPLSSQQAGQSIRNFLKSREGPLRTSRAARGLWLLEVGTVLAMMVLARAVWRHQCPSKGVVQQRRCGAQRGYMLPRTWADVAGGVAHAAKNNILEWTLFVWLMMELEARAVWRSVYLIYSWGLEVAGNKYSCLSTHGVMAGGRVLDRMWSSYIFQPIGSIKWTSDFKWMFQAQLA